MPPRRGKGRPGKKTVVQEEPAPAAVEEDAASNTSSRPQSPQGMPELPGPVVPAEPAVPPTAAPPPPAAKAKRQKKEALNLTDDQEQDVADWYRSQEMLYNRRLAQYKRTDIKSRMIDQKAKELGCTAQQLKTWIDSMRTSVGKLTDPSKKPSGGAARILTDRDNWIMENFGYLERHIKRVDAGKRKKGGKLSQSLSAKTPSSSNRPTTEDDTSEAEEVIVDSSDDGGRDSDTSRSKGGPYKGGSSSSRRKMGAPPPSKKTSRRHHEPRHHHDCDSSSLAASGDGIATQAVTQLIEKATDLQRDMHSKLSQPTDSGSLSKRVFTDMIYHEVMQMDTDTWWDYQAQTLNNLMQFKQAYRRKRQQQQQQQQQQQLQQQQQYHHFLPPVPQQQQFVLSAPATTASSSGPPVQMFPHHQHSSSPAAQMFTQHSSSPAAQMFAQHSSSPAARMFATPSGPSPQALVSSAPSSSVPAPIPPPATSSTIISQAWLTSGPSHGRPSMSPQDCSTPQDVSLTSYLLNTSVGGMVGGDDHNSSFSVPTPPTTTTE